MLTLKEQIERLKNLQTPYFVNKHGDNIIVTTEAILMVFDAQERLIEASNDFVKTNVAYFPDGSCVVCNVYEDGRVITEFNSPSVEITLKNGEISIIDSPNYYYNDGNYYHQLYSNGSVVAEYNEFRDEVALYDGTGKGHDDQWALCTYDLENQKLF